jgi:hypothetical protein
MTLYAFIHVALRMESNSQQQNDCPIIFICHSLGGLVCEDVSCRPSRPCYLARLDRDGKGMVYAEARSIVEGRCASTI